MQTGLLQYKKATKGIRSSQDIIDQQFKLVFVYPLLFDENLMKFQNQVRDFITVSMLKELFVSNALDMVSASNKIHPLVDEQGNEVHPQQNIQSIKFAADGHRIDDLSFQNYNPNQSAEEIRRSIQEKTANIRNILKADPKLSKFRPYLEMITMENMIDVPVIVGTKGFAVDTNTMMFLLIIAISQDLKFDDYSDVQKMFRILKNTKPEDAHNLLDSLLTASQDNRKISERIKGYFSNLLPDSRSRTSQMEKSPEEYNITPEQSFQILQSAQDKMRKTEMFFDFILDKEKLKKQFGVDVTEGQVSATLTRINKDIDETFNEFESSFIKTISIYASPAITSLVHMLTPSTGRVIDITKLREEHVNNKLINEVSSFIHNEIRDMVDNTFSSQKVATARNTVEKLSSMCSDEFQDADQMLNEIAGDLKNNYIPNMYFSEEELENFIETMDGASDASGTQSRRIYKSLADLLGGQAGQVLRKIDDIISRFLSGLIDEIRANNPNFSESRLIQFTPVTSELLNQIQSSIHQYLSFLFMYNLQITICKYVDTVKTEIETTEHSVIDYPNYTLVLPSETIMAVAGAFAAKSFEDFTKGGGLPQGITRLMQQLNERNIQQVTQRLCTQLKIPNLIVIDQQQQALYHKLMHQSSAQKMNLRTLDTYVQKISSEVLEN